MVGADAEQTKAQFDALIPYYKACYFLHLLNISTEQGLHEISAKQSIALLKYIPMIPVDKVFEIECFGD